jgi:hypothetical protein
LKKNNFIKILIFFHLATVLMFLFGGVLYYLYLYFETRISIKDGSFEIVNNFMFNSEKYMYTALYLCFLLFCIDIVFLIRRSNKKAS